MSTLTYEEALAKLETITSKEDLKDFLINDIDITASGSKTVFFSEESIK